MKYNSYRITFYYQQLYGYSYVEYAPNEDIARFLARRHEYVLNHNVDHIYVKRIYNRKEN